MLGLVQCTDCLIIDKFCINIGLRICLALLKLSIKWWCQNQLHCSHYISFVYVIGLPDLLKAPQGHGFINCKTLFGNQQLSKQPYSLHVCAVQTHPHLLLSRAVGNICIYTVAILRVCSHLQKDHTESRAGGCGIFSKCSY